MSDTTSSTTTLCVTDVSVDSLNPLNGRCAVSWTGLDGQHYHFWTDIAVDGTELVGCREDVLYKNPPHGTKSSDPGFYHARKLTMDGKKNAEMIRDALAFANEHRLFAKAVQDHADLVAANRAAAAEAARLARIKEHGVELFTTGREFVEWFKEFIGRQGMREIDGSMLPECSCPQFMAFERALNNAEAQS